MLHIVSCLAYRKLSCILLVICVCKPKMLENRKSKFHDLTFFVITVKDLFLIFVLFCNHVIGFKFTRVWLTCLFSRELHCGDVVVAKSCVGRNSAAARGGGASLNKPVHPCRLCRTVYRRDQGSQEEVCPGVM